MKRLPAFLTKRDFVPEPGWLDGAEVSAMYDIIYANARREGRAASLTPAQVYEQARQLVIELHKHEERDNGVRPQVLPY